MAELPDFQHDVFISYKHHTSDRVVEFVEAALLRAGLTCWRDAGDLPFGPEFLKRIVLALERSRIVVPIISAEYLKSEWCVGELFVGKAFNCLVPVFTDGIVPKELPFNVDVDFGAHAAELMKSPEILNKFCRSAFSLTSARMHRTGFSDQQLPPVAGGPVHVVRELYRWPYPPLAPHRVRARLLASHELLSTSEKAEVKSAYAVFSHPLNVIAGLVELRNALDAEQTSPQEWTALGRIARPFSKPISSYAFAQAKMSIDQMADEEYLVLETPKQRQKNARPLRQQRKLPAKLQRHLDQIEPLVPKQTTVVNKPTSRHQRTTRKSSIEAVQPFAASSGAVTRFLSWIRSQLGRIRVRPGVTTTSAGALVAPSMPLSTATSASLENRRPRLANRRPFVWIDLMIACVVPVAVGALVLNPPESTKSLGGSQGNEPPPITSGSVPTMTPPTAPEAVVVPPYCDQSLRCVFPKNYSLSWVARDCFGDNDRGRWEEIWRLNREKLRDADPNKVWEGEAFLLPVSRCPALVR